MAKASSTEKNDQRPDPRLFSIQLGVWKVTMLRDTGFNIRKHATDLMAAGPLFKRLATEIYKIEPILFFLYIASRLWSAVESAVLLYLSSRLLRIIEIGLTRGNPDTTAVISATVARLACICAVGLIDWWSEKTLPLLKSRIKAHFELYLMEAKLRLDIPTSEEPRSKTQVSARDAWSAFSGIIDFCMDLVRTASQMALIFETSRSNGDPLFALACLAKPIICSISKQSLWWRAHIVSSNNPHYDRLVAVGALASAQYRADVIGGDLAGYILGEYEKANELLAGASDDWVGSQYDRRDSPTWEIVVNLLGDLPMVYCAIIAVLYPSKFTVSSIAILQQSSSMLRWSLESVLANADSFRRQLMEIRNLYEAANIANTLSDGSLPYPDPLSEKNKGMSVQLSNVSFTYPGKKSDSNALSDVSLSIKAGQLVVIVGANGSGKSSLIKLFTRMYDPTSGQILIDGEPIQSYRMRDLRQATATLTQDHHLFPLSLGENIGMGNTEFVNDLAMITKAAELGGATHCISKLAGGLDTILEPLATAYGCNLVDDPADPLQQELEKMKRKTALSGGEQQRVVASRTFMRFTSGRVKLVAVDEPSSALDPEGEAQLFDNLRAVREGKTMIFVTHRFGHLTKHADLIICMKDGSVAEAGRHEELLALDGEYAKLYNIQASAFVDTLPN